MLDEKIQVDFSENIEINHPKCKHGPALLFSSSPSSTKFFACSACRDRQDCDLLIPYEKKEHKKSRRMIKAHEKEYSEFRKHIRKIQRNRKKCLGQSNIYYCYTCSVLYPSTKQSIHIEHKHTESLTAEQLRQPCRYVLQPLENKRSNAQFFFSPLFIDYLINKLILKGSWDSVLCIGCPTIFENLQEKRKIPSYLLDFDIRFCSFYSGKEMLVYNMFNGHIFSGRKPFEEKFLSTKKNCLIILDPPFGGFHRALTYSIRQLFQSKNDIQHNLILFNPYFLEKWLVDAFPDLKMLDYKIEYTSKSSLHLCRGKKGSPVRMFTDISPSKFPPLDETNYKYCFECDRYTLLTNQHCFQCQACTSKDGLPYKHCFSCQRCVKAERKHCEQCNVCHLPNECMRKSEKRENQSEEEEEDEEQRQNKKLKK